VCDALTGFSGLLDRLINGLQPRVSWRYRFACRPPVWGKFSMPDGAWPRNRGYWLKLLQFLPAPSSRGKCFFQCSESFTRLVERGRSRGAGCTLAFAPVRGELSRRRTWTKPFGPAYICEIMRGAACFVGTNTLHLNLDEIGPKCPDGLQAAAEGISN